MQLLNDVIPILTYSLCIGLNSTCPKEYYHVSYSNKKPKKGDQGPASTAKGYR